MKLIQPNVEPRYVSPPIPARSRVPAAGAARATAVAAPPLDTRLIALVQIKAGSKCHQSAGLLNGYYLCAEVYRRALRRGDARAAHEARREFQQSENRLRDFLLPLACMNRGAGVCGRTT